ncbi:MAG: FAD-dependent 5-carboxymethylaminomethyl-2-thiouridine(34) oxidoreductase MnmC [Pseudobdellovibrionaceae bacterium]
MITPHSEHFDDIYFAVEDGLAESRYVFLDHNHLPAAFAERERFVIAETGFGTGLNFLCAWELFERTAKPFQKLVYYSFEKYPLAASDILRFLGHWSGAFGGRLERFAALYPLRVGGWHRIDVSPHVTLVLIFDDVNRALFELDDPVDCWFLDGHAPAKNPEMWSSTVFEQMGRLSRKGARFATFTAAGFVRRGLEAAGFEVSRMRGYGRKRDMSVGVFTGAGCVGDNTPEPRRVAVVGGGVAGCAAAAALAERGCAVTIFEPHGIASGASGNPRGLYNPRFSARRSGESDFYASAYARAAAVFLRLMAQHDIGFAPVGCLHLITDSDKERRFEAFAENWGWHTDHARLVDAAEASLLSGVTLQHGALYLPDAGALSPARLCKVLSSAASIRQTQVRVLERVSEGWRVEGDVFDAVVLACARGVQQFDGVPSLPLQSIRGQVSFVQENAAFRTLKTALCYGGYCAPCEDGQAVVGSTFQHWLAHTDLLAEDDSSNLEKLAAFAPSLAAGAQVVGGRAGIRVAASDRVPVIGCIQGQDGLYVSVGHGSHGILSGLMGGAFIAADMMGDAQILPRAAQEALSPARFAARQARISGT